MGKKLKTLTYVWFVAIFTCLAIPAAAQTEDKQDKAAAPRQSSDTVQRDPSADKQAEPDKQPTLDVKPGSPAIKTSAEREPLSPLKHLPSHILKDQKAIWTSPFHTSRQDAKWWAIFGVTTAAFVATDRWTSRQLPNTKSQVTAGDWASKMGALYTLIPLDAGFYAIGTVTHSERFRETALIGEEALIDALITETLLKTIFDRERPLEGNGHGRFFQGNGRFWNSGASFPSGHAVNTWALASVIAHEYPRPRIIPILVYSYAMGVNAARFVARKHFASDVVAGAAIGWFIGDFVYGKRHNPELTASQPAWKRVLAHVHFGGIQ
jgi:membrane-associated phospholipid phosphatase